MDNLTMESIQAILSSRGGLNPRTGASGFMLVREGDTLARETLKPKAVGHFDGKAGSMRRSRKGRTYRLANGRRSYIHNWDMDIVAYKVRSK